MRAISIQQPWAWLILHAGKDIENRTWPLPGKMLGERVLIHAGKRFDAPSASRLFALLEQQGLVDPAKTPSLDELRSMTGGVVGSCVFSRSTRDSSSPWAMAGLWHWLIRDQRPEPFRPLRGRLGFFEASA